MKTKPNTYMHAPHQLKKKKSNSLDSSKPIQIATKNQKITPFSL